MKSIFCIVYFFFLLLAVIEAWQCNFVETVNFCITYKGV